MKNTRRRFLAATGIAAAAAAVPNLAVAALSRSRKDRPNILFILADDLGYADLSCYGRRDYETPTLDKLASEGMRFTQAYSNSPVCSPTRMALATGRYQYRLAGGLEEPIGAGGVAAGAGQGLPPSSPTLASLLKKAGYRTALLGKWHLGELPGYGPLKSGYDRFFGISGGGADYASHTSVGPAARPDLYDGEKLVDENGYLTDILTRKAAEFLTDANRHDAPFLLSLHYTAPHWPWQLPGDPPVSKEESLFNLHGGSLAIYARMVQSLDAGIAQVLAALRKAGLDSTTLVVFTSDNGGERFSDNWPFTGQKMDLLEGGIRVPQIVRWKGNVPAGRVSEQSTITMDWTNTLLTLGGGTADPAYPLDGTDLTDVLRGSRTVTARTLYWRMFYRQQAALRAGDWKYLRLEGNEFLFDLAADPRERANRRAADPQRFEAMKAQWAAWNQTMLPLPATQRPYFTSKDLAGYYD